MISQARPTNEPPTGEEKRPTPLGPHPLGPLAENIDALREFGAYYLETRLDGMRLRLRRAAMATVVGLIAGAAAVTGLITAVVLLLTGAAGALTVAFGGRVWAGNLAVGGGVVLIVAVGLWALKTYLASSARRRTVEKYEHQRDQQRARCGRHASGPVAER